MLRILIAEDHAAVRRVIRSMVESHPELHVVGEATNGHEAIDLCERLKPDVVLLDVMMPKLNGLEAMKEILRVHSAPQVLILTTHHQSEALSREVIRNGAEGIVAKSAAHELLIPALQSLIERRHGIHLAGSVLRGKHVAVFSHSKVETNAVLDPFIAEGLRQGYKVVPLIDPNDRDDLVRRLRDQGLDIQSAEARRQLEFVPWKDLYLPDGSIEYETVYNLWENVRQSAAASGFARMRAIGYMDWTLKVRAGMAFLPDFEAQLDRFFQGFDDVGTCAYDLSSFANSVIGGVARSHPEVVVNGSLEENRSYVPPVVSP